MPKCLDCKMEVSFAHAIKNPTHTVVAISNNPRVRGQIKSLIERYRWKSIPPEPLEGADDLTINIRKDHVIKHNDSPSLWWLAIPAAIALGIVIFVYRSNRSEEVDMSGQEPDNFWDAYHG